MYDLNDYDMEKAARCSWGGIGLRSRAKKSINLEVDE